MLNSADHINFYDLVSVYVKVLIIILLYYYKFQ